MSQTSAKMDEIKKKLVERDREKAMNALMEYIHYEIAPKAPTGESTAVLELFGCRADVEEFCREREVRNNALEWLLKELRAVSLLEQTEMPARLSRHGAERYCRS